jgi:hypothetical protein
MCVLASKTPYQRRPSRTSPPAADKKVFPKLELVGWYSTGSALVDADLELQRLVRTPVEAPRTPRWVASVPSHASRLTPQMNGITENAVYALFNPNVLVAKELPLTLYECGEWLVEGKKT